MPIKFLEKRGYSVEDMRDLLRHSFYTGFLLSHSSPAPSPSPTPLHTRLKVQAIKTTSNKKNKRSFDFLEYDW
jgi:hypothetical protein